MPDSLDERTARGVTVDVLGASNLLRVLLQNRGIGDSAESEAFLNPDYERHTHDPFLLKDMDKAVARIMRALSTNEKIILYTDYDTDGLPAGVLLRDAFRALEYACFENYIPHRHDEGYGLNIEAVESFAARGVRLVITADCGISDIEAVARAQELGIDVIVTDHHTPRRDTAAAGQAADDELPPAYAVINPKRKDDVYPFKGLCGAAVAFKLVQALFVRARENGYQIREGREKWLLDLVGIATICDMVPLVGENRVLARYGLVVLQKTRRPGLRQFFAAQRITPEAVTEDDIGFVIGPRINAAGRMSSPDKAFQFLGADTAEEAGAIVRELNHLNDRRKGLVAAIVKEARLRLDGLRQGAVRGTEDDGLPSVIVLGNTRWHPGVLGLAANTLMGEYDKPVFVWGEGTISSSSAGASGERLLKGSCRSDGRVHVVELMEKAGHVLSGFGGHHAAGGFSVARTQVHLLPDALNAGYAAVSKHAAAEEQRIDAVLPIDAVGRETHRIIEKLAPFGIGNPKPLFLFENVSVRDVQWFGKQKEHLKILCGPTRIPAIQFFADRNQNIPQTGGTFSFTAHIEKNIFRGRAEVRMRIVAFND